MKNKIHYPLIVFMLLTPTVFFSGCGDPVTGYRLSGHNPAAVRKILVLPFLDARTFRDQKDPVAGKLGYLARDLFVEVLKKNPVLGNKTILVPEVARDETSLSLAEALDYGFRFDADLVIVGQIFSYTETRAASIPPRAGMFVRFFSVPDRRVVFVGDDYKYAGGPGAKGGRRLQAELVATDLINSYVANNPASGNKGQPDAPARNIPGPIVLKDAPENAPKILVLPYHERNNPNNLISKTGGGAVVTSIFRMELAKRHFAQIFTPAALAAGHKRLLSIDEVLALGREMGVDYVLRGQVVEFRRAMSVPSLYSVIISTAILAAQILFAEVSGVDIATELWRVSDGKCIYAKRDISKQKYVVQAEKTVRRLAVSNADAIAGVIAHAPARLPRPLIDAIKVVDRTRNRRKAPAPKKTAPAVKMKKTDPGSGATDKPETKKKTARRKTRAAKPDTSGRPKRPRPIHEQDEGY